jgi:hypothetical protein
MVWKSFSSQTPNKAQVSKSVGKQMFIIFMDAEGVILTHRSDGQLGVSLGVHVLLKGIIYSFN